MQECLDELKARGCEECQEQFGVQIVDPKDVQHDHVYGEKITELSNLPYWANKGVEAMRKGRCQRVTSHESK